MVKGRFAPSPTGRMHLGNIFTAYLSRKSAKEKGGKWLLRIEDLDPGRSRYEYARQIEDDLDWLGLTWDEGGVDDSGDAGPYRQSLRSEIYDDAFRKLAGMGVTYPCRCRRSDIMATQAPHREDGRVVYAGTCRPTGLPPFNHDIIDTCVGGGVAVRLCVENKYIEFVDGRYGRQRVNLADDCGDFVVRRADGAWAYQLAVVVDDALMGVTEIVRGNDLLLSAAQQIYLYELLGFDVPTFTHVPLLCNSAGQRLSKRDMACSMEHLRKVYTPQSLCYYLEELASTATSTQRTIIVEIP